MNIRGNTFLFLIACILLLASGCARKATRPLDAALDLYKQNKLDQALPLLGKMAKEQPSDAEVHAWLAETLRRLGKKAEAVSAARDALAIDPRSSFAHTVIADAMDPVFGLWPGANADSTWSHLHAAIACDSTDGNAWLLMWGEAMRRNDAPLAAQSLRRLHETGFLAPAALSYGRWMLSGLPPNAILLTNGDMDTYPPCALQASQGYRTDVIVVNRSLLNTTWYARFLRDHAALPLPFDDAALAALEPVPSEGGGLLTVSDRICRAWLEQRAAGTLARPLVFSSTVDPDFLKLAGGNVRYGGAVLLCCDPGQASAPDTAAVLAALTAVSPEAFFGPWVSERDRSPIRRVHTKSMAHNVTEVALRYAELLTSSGKPDDAGRWITWAERLDKGNEAGSFYADKIKELRNALAQRKN
jgi:hypothetical protein